MSFLLFVSKIIEAVAWPSAAVIIALAFRSELKSLMPLLRKLKVGSLEAEFEREVKTLEKEVSNSIPLEFSPETEPLQHELLQLASINPRSAIIEAWRRIESAIRKVALYHGGSPATSHPIHFLPLIR